MMGFARIKAAIIESERTDSVQSMMRKAQITAGNTLGYAGMAVFAGTMAPNAGSRAVVGIASLLSGIEAARTARLLHEARRA